MYQVELRLTYRNEADAPRPIEGWYLPGADVDQWLRKVHSLRQGSPHRRLFIAPKSLQDQAGAGLICLSKSGVARPAIPANAVGLCRLHVNGKNELWLPVHGKLVPESGAKIWLQSQHSVQTTMFVWLPSTGLIRFEQDDEKVIADFIRRPVHRLVSASRQWTQPPAAVSLPDRLVDIKRLTELTFKQIFASESSDIGGDEKLLPKLREDGTASDQGFGEKIRNWFMRSVQGSGPDANQSDRDRQIEKLLELMKRDPDKALRYAIPMTALQAFRGLAKSGSKLTMGSTDFSLAKLFGGGGKPAEVWDLDAKMRAQLNSAYREQANREVAAGRHRRAAYIHAHLLGDLTSAASILERGEHYNEAAVLYGEKLNRPKDQARCLALAGQSGEAALIYESVREFELAAAVWESAEEPERAREAYEKAISKRIDDRQPREAAIMIFEKLQDDKRAEGLLWQQWPGGFAPLECAELGFSWLAERQMHCEARERLGWVVAESGKANRLTLAKLTAGLSKSFPDVALREAAEDHCRIAIAMELQKLDYRQVEQPLTILRSLCSDDSLLIRDTRRFQEADRLKQVKLEPPLDRSAKDKLKPLSSVCLPASHRYVAAQMIGNELLSFAWSDDDLFAMRSSECVGNQIQTERFKVTGRQKLGDLPLNYCWNVVDQDVTICLSFRGQQRDYESIGLNTKRSSDCKWYLQSNPNPKEQCGVFSADGARYSLAEDYGTISVVRQKELSSFDLQLLVGSALAATDQESDDQSEDWTDAIFAVAVDKQALFAIGRMLLCMVRGKPSIQALLDSNVSCLAASLPQTARRVAVSTSKSLSVVWLERNCYVETISKDDGYGQVAFLSGGYLIATTDTYLRIFRLFQRSSDVTQLVEERLLQSRDVVAILPLNADHFGVLYRNGLLERFRVQR